MRYGQFSLIGILIILLGWAPLSAEEREADERVLSAGIDAGLKQSFLNVNNERQCQNCGTSAVDYDTEGVNLYWVRGSLNLWNASVFELEYERPFKDSATQNQLLSANNSKDTTYEKVFGGIVLDPLAKQVFSGDRLSHEILKRLTSIKYTVTQEVFTGKAKANSASVFLPQDTIIDYNTNTIVNGTPIAGGTDLSFQTKYRDRELTFGLATVHPLILHLTEGTLRLGYYKATWERLSDTQISQLSSSPIVYEAEFKSEGIAVSYETTNPSAQGLHVNLAAKIGTDDRLKSAIDWNQVNGSDVDVQTLMAKFHIWYNHYFQKTERRGWSLSGGLSLDIRETKIKINDSAVVQTLPNTDNRDTLLKYFISTGYRF